MTYGYQYFDDGSGNPRQDMAIRWPDGASIPNNELNRDWMEYQKWLAEGNVTYPIGYCYQSTLSSESPDRNDPVTEFPDFLVISSTDEDLTLWNAYQDWWDQGWRPIAYP